jgi:hypothetical protein
MPRDNNGDDDDDNDSGKMNTDDNESKPPANKKMRRQKKSKTTEQAASTTTIQAQQIIQHAHQQHHQQHQQMNIMALQQRQQLELQIMHQQQQRQRRRMRQHNRHPLHYCLRHHVTGNHGNIGSSKRTIKEESCDDEQCGNDDDVQLSDDNASDDDEKKPAAIKSSAFDSSCVAAATTSTSTSAIGIPAAATTTTTTTNEDARKIAGCRIKTEKNEDTSNITNGFNSNNSNNNDDDDDDDDSFYDDRVEGNRCSSSTIATTTSSTTTTTMPKQRRMGFDHTTWQRDIFCPRQKKRKAAALNAAIDPNTAAVAAETSVSAAEKKAKTRKKNNIAAKKNRLKQKKKKLAAAAVLSAAAAAADKSDDEIYDDEEEVDEEEQEEEEYHDSSDDEAVKRRMHNNIRANTAAGMNKIEKEKGKNNTKKKKRIIMGPNNDHGKTFADHHHDSKSDGVDENKQSSSSSSSFGRDTAAATKKKDEGTENSSNSRMISQKKINSISNNNDDGVYSINDRIGDYLNNASEPGITGKDDDDDDDNDDNAYEDDGDNEYNKDSDDDDDNNAVLSTKAKKGKDTLGRCTSFYDRSWDEHFQCLLAYKKEYNSTTVPKAYKVNDLNLGIWVFRQRTNFKNKGLSVERTKRLESIRVVLKRTEYRSWDEHFQCLVAYKKEYNSTTVPRTYKVNDVNLGSWVNSQRTKFKNKELSLDRMGRLKSIKFVSNINDPWVEMYQRLVAYKIQHKSTNVPYIYKKDPKLGAWVSKQRNFYKNNELSEERFNHLESVGFVWSLFDVKWTEMYIKLVEYKRQNHGSTVVPKKYTEDPSLGKWVCDQNYAYNKGNLSEKRLKVLNAINFVWSAKKDCVPWMEMYQKLVAYKKKHKSTNVPLKYQTDPKLGSWVSTQRKSYNKKVLSIDRINHLELIDFVWSAKKDCVPWMEMYQRLVAYKKQNKSTIVPKLYVEDPPLDRWASLQRKSYSKNVLSTDRINHLELIDFVWDSHDAKWMEMYSKLVKYRKQNKSTIVPKLYVEDPPLDRWASLQRKNYSKKVLSTDRINHLELIDFVWDSHDAKWMEMYSKLVKYRKQNKSTIVPKLYVEDPPLDRWASLQRNVNNQGKLSEKRWKLLNAINFV